MDGKNIGFSSRAIMNENFDFSSTTVIDEKYRFFLESCNGVENIWIHIVGSIFWMKNN